MDWEQVLLGVLILTFFPLLLAAYGARVVTESISDARTRRTVNLKVWALCFAGVLATAGYLYHRSRIDAEQQQKLRTGRMQAEAAETRLQANEIAGAKELQRIQRRLSLVLDNPHPHGQQLGLLQLREELAGAVADKLAGRIKEQAKVGQATVSAKPSLSPSPTPEPCRRDKLNECNDASLLAWGTPVLQRLKVVVDNFEEAASGTDKQNPKWFSTFDAAQVQAAEAFRDCCAEDALNYHKELATRLGDKHADPDLYDWTRKLLKPVGSHDYNDAVHDSKTILFYYDLRLMQTELEVRVRDGSSR